MDCEQIQKLILGSLKKDLENQALKRFESAKLQNYFNILGKSLLQIIRKNQEDNVSNHEVFWLVCEFLSTVCDVKVLQADEAY